jgi:hypothetical protein
VVGPFGGEKNSLEPEFEPWYEICFWRRCGILDLAGKIADMLDEKVVRKRRFLKNESVFVGSGVLRFDVLPGRVKYLGNLGICLENIRGKTDVHCSEKTVGKELPEANIFHIMADRDLTKLRAHLL